MNFGSRMSKKAENEAKSQFRLLREGAGLTLAELGKQVGVSDRNVWDWENGHALPRLDRAVAVARALGISLKELCRALKIDVDDLSSE